MPDLPSPPAALRRRATAEPESPFLFWPEGWNWRWWSWRQVAEQMDRWQAPLAGLPPGALVGFAGGAYPDAVPLDLAVQEAGMTAVPLAAGQAGNPGQPEANATGQEGAAAGCDAWLELAAGEPRVVETAGSGAAAVAGKGAGGLVVTEVGGIRRWLAAADVAVAAERLESEIAADGNRRAGGRRARQILVAGEPLGEWPARLLTAWAILTGAALVLQSDPSMRLGTVRWARPTVFHGNAAEIAALRQQLEESRHPRRWWRQSRRGAPRSPFGRLGTLFQSEAPALDDLAFWQEHGVRLLRLPALGEI